MISFFNKVLSKIVATITTMIVDNSKNSTIHLYGIAHNKINYVRSDDIGLTWVVIAESEYITVRFDLLFNL